MEFENPTVIITSNLYKPFIGGVENSLYHLALAYLELGYRPIIIVSDLTTDENILPEFEQKSGIDIYRYNMTSSSRFLGIPLPIPISTTLNLIRLYKRINSQFKPKFLVSRYHYNQLFAKLSGFKNTIYLVPGIVKYQNSAKTDGEQNFKRWMQWHLHLTLQYWALKSSDRIAVFSENMVTQVNDVVPQKVRPLLTKPGVDDKRFVPLSTQQKLMGRQQQKLATQGKVFLCVGRCVKAKGFDIVIDAFSKTQSDSAQLWVVGDGPLMSDYQRQVKQLGLTDNVRFFGAQAEPERLYQLADFFVMSSIYEPLGQTILEAMSSGLPVIAFSPSEDVHTASHELLPEEQTIFVKKPDADLLAVAIDEAISWPDSRYRLNADKCRQHAIEKYTWKSLAKELAEEFPEKPESPLVSVYIPTKNRVQLLKRAVNSVMAQSYPNIEIIIVDDCSSDETHQYLTQLKERHQNIKAISLTIAMGAPEARNHAIKLATGELITGLDDDDYFLPDRIKNLVGMYDKKYSFICSGYYWNYGRIKVAINSSNAIISLDKQLHLNLASNQVLIDRKRLLDVGGFDKSFNSCQDWELWTRIIVRYGNALRISSLDYVVDVSHGTHRITDNTDRVLGFKQFLCKFSNHMNASHRKSLDFHINVAEGKTLTLANTLKLMTLPLWQRNLKYWLSCRFPKIAQWRLERLK
jgi:1,2-diacylglycerol 3-alpha-glucosyltransferase